MIYLHLLAKFGPAAVHGLRIYSERTYRQTSLQLCIRCTTLCECVINV